MIAARRDFADRQSLAAALARDIARTLEAGMTGKSDALLAVSGGTTPKQLFGELSRQPIDWPHVTVTLVDERCVPAENERSNARLVRTHLLVNDAAAAAFVPLFENECEASKLGRFDAVILGMGTDGHTASFFPGSERLADALDMQTAKRIIAITAPGEPRLTFSFASLIDSGFIALHIEGAEKAATLAQAMEPGPVEAMPIRAFLNAPEPITVYWSP